MTDNKAQASGGDGHKGENPVPGTEGAGESGGGAYPNPHSGKSPKDGFSGQGGQTDVEQKAPGKTLGDLGKA